MIPLIIIHRPTYLDYEENELGEMSKTKVIPEQWSVCIGNPYEYTCISTSVLYSTAVEVAESLLTEWGEAAIRLNTDSVPVFTGRYYAAYRRKYCNTYGAWFQSTDLDDNIFNIDLSNIVLDDYIPLSPDCGDNCELCAEIRRNKI